MAGRFDFSFAAMFFLFGISAIKGQEIIGPENVFTTTGQDVTFHCIYSKVSHIGIAWVKTKGIQQTKITETTKNAVISTSLDGTSSFLHLSNVDVNDEGMYTCIIGEHSSTAYLVIKDNSEHTTANWIILTTMLAVTLPIIILMFSKKWWNRLYGKDSSEYQETPAINQETVDNQETPAINQEAVDNQETPAINQEAVDNQETPAINQEAVNESLVEVNMSAFAAFFKENGGNASAYVNGWQSVKVKFALIGSSGAGKSTFINTIRGLKPRDEGAAEEGLNETTTVVTPYEHPLNSNIVLYDLPGVGTTSFPRDTYLQCIKFNKYDFFFLLSSNRFTEDDFYIANELKRSSKHFAFVRSKFDVDLRMGTERHKKNAAAVYEEIFNFSLDKFSGNEKPKVFMVDCTQNHSHDFPRLIKYMLAELDGIKKAVVVYSLKIYSKEFIESKTSTLKERVPYIAAASAAANVGLPYFGKYSLVAESEIILTEVRFYLNQLGLDQESLEELVDRFSKDLEYFRSNLYFSKEMDANLSGKIHQLFNQASTYFTVNKVLATPAWLLPVLGTTISAVHSFFSTRYILYDIIDKMEKESLRVAYAIAELKHQESVID